MIMRPARTTYGAFDPGLYLQQDPQVFGDVRHAADAFLRIRGMSCKRRRAATTGVAHAWADVYWPGAAPGVVPRERWSLVEQAKFENQVGESCTTM